jgi:hypothetical protein
MIYQKRRARRYRVHEVTMSWHFLAVWRDLSEGERTYSLCEVYFDESGRLDGWTESPVMTPSGCDLDDLIGALQHMLDDARAYEPVAFDELRPGMQIKRRVVE